MQILMSSSVSETACNKRKYCIYIVIFEVLTSTFEMLDNQNFTTLKYCHSAFGRWFISNPTTGFVREYNV